MSIRSVAAAIAHYYGGDYIDYHYQAQVCALDETTTEITKMIVVDRLREHGFDEWRVAARV